MVWPGFFRYWGKWGGVEQEYHLLVFHALDAASCCAELIRLPKFSLLHLANDLHWSKEMANQVCVAMMAMHDLGKFAPGFQNLQSAKDQALVACSKRYTYDARNARHDTLGWLLWSHALRNHFPPATGFARGFWAPWICAVMGHHGKPPKEAMHGGLMPLSLERLFSTEQITDARDFVEAMAALLLPQSIPACGNAEGKRLEAHSWQLAGIAVLADWLASNRKYFPYRKEPMALEEYYAIARLQARKAIHDSGLAAQQSAPWMGAQTLLPHFHKLTPLQHYAGVEENGRGPQFYLLEDVTGAGKTEAALLLAHRLMAEERASGIYFALPTMATANQLYRRVGEVYRRLYAETAQPSLILAHGARRMVRDFRQSILPEDADPESRPELDPGGAAQCTAWLADNSKKAMLADVGVGTIDQALQAILPVRHQSLRLLGLASKVLIVDEVHAYDAYMTELLEKLLAAQARQGGSVILLSATVPAALRERLLRAFQRGCGKAQLEVPGDARYPLATHYADEQMLRSTACDTRPELVRAVQVRFLHDAEACLRVVTQATQSGKCVCWIRNTIEDAREAYAALQQEVRNDKLQLFHSRFAMGDRLQIEEEVLRRFGAGSTAAHRSGQVLAASQVVEQSLDLDFDVLISDLAPMDLLIQRAGRLHRHCRDSAGNRCELAQDGRGQSVLYVLAPKWTEEPAERWFAQIFPRACFVYPDAGQLWRTQRALQAAGEIRTPGNELQVGGLRRLMEAVYGKDAPAVPENLLKSTQQQIGKIMAERSMAKAKSIDTSRAYRDDEITGWSDAGELSTRLGEESQMVYLARVSGGILQPWVEQEELAWQLSSLRVDKRLLADLAPEWQQKHQQALSLVKRNPLLEESLVLPMEAEGDGWRGLAMQKGRVVEVRYDSRIGFSVMRSGGN